MKTRDYLKKFARPILIDRTRTTILSLPLKLRRKPPKHYLGYIMADKPPIILLQGFGTSWRTISKLGDFISRLGYPVHVVDKLGQNTSAIPDSAKLVKDHIERENLKNVIIVAHSKGGLIGKYLLTYLNKDGRVNGMVTISCPFNGTAMVGLIPWKKAKELDINSPIISDLTNHLEPNKKIISISSKEDENIWSEKGCFLPEAMKNVVAKTSGHSHLLFVEEGRRLVKESIEKIAELKN